MKETKEMKDIFGAFDGNETLHDTAEMKRLFLSGSPLGKNIMKKEAQLLNLKELLSTVDEKNTSKELKDTIEDMYKLYETGKSLETKMGYLERTYKHVTLLSIAYNYTAAKIEGLSILKSKFETEIDGF